MRGEEQRVEALLRYTCAQCGETGRSCGVVGDTPSLKIVRGWGGSELFWQRQRGARAHHFQPYFRAFASCSASVWLKSCRPPLLGIRTK